MNETDLDSRHSRRDVTDLLVRWSEGDEAAFEELLPLVYRELRRLAGSQFAGESETHTLQPTALVHEAYLKLLGRDPGRVENRRHFYALAAKAMRQILVDQSRRRAARKRAGDRFRVTLTDALGQEIQMGTEPVDALDLDTALRRLEKIRPRAAKVVELRYFGGLTTEEVADVLGVVRKTVTRDWNTARLWLMERLKTD